MPLFLLKLIPLIMKFGPIAKFIPFFKGNWKIIVPVVGLGLLLFAFNARGNKIDKLELIRDDYIAFIAATEDMNRSNLETIASLKSANKSLAEVVVVSEEIRAASYAESLERERRAVAELNVNINKLQELENETPACAEFSRIDIGAICPLSVEQLRRAAEGPLDRD